jgi:hypothetical protein
MKVMKWDVFVSHASEDKDAVAEPLVHALVEAGLRVWYDRIELSVGDSLRRRIDEGLGSSRFGIVVLSAAFFAKHWPQQELNGLAQREVGGEKVILPVWYELGVEEVRRYSPMLADRVAARWSDGLETVAAQILDAVHGEGTDNRTRARSAFSTPPIRAEGVNYSSLVLIASPKGKNLFVHSERIESAETVRLDLVPANARERAFLSGFADQRREQIYVAYDVTAIFGQIESISHTRAGGKEHWNLEVKPDEPSQSAQRGEVLIFRTIVRPAKAGMFSGRQSHRGNSQDPVAWVAFAEETKRMPSSRRAIDDRLSCFLTM